MLYTFVKSTLHLWVLKIGYYELHKPKPHANDWIILLDESVQVGSKKLLLIIGFQQCHIDFTRPLVYQDLTPLFGGGYKSWRGEDIAKVLNNLRSHIGTILYAIADCGNNIIH